MGHVISSDGRGEVRGVTVCNEKLFVLRDESEQIEQYHVKTFDELTLITVKGLMVDRNDSWLGYKSLTSCSINNCLYVNDEFAVFRVDLSTNNVISWRVDGYPCGLSVNRTSNVLVTCHFDNVIKEYSTSGSLVRSIRLQVKHMTRPLHTVQLADGQYVVSHFKPEHAVSLIDQRGTVIATCRNSKTTKLISEPRCIVVVNKSILVTDCDNNRILVLNSSLNDARELSLPVESQLELPRCMYLDQSSGRLYVGEWNAGRVLLFDNINLYCIDSIHRRHVFHIK